MIKRSHIFLDLPQKQIELIFDYVMHVGKGTKENAESMKALINQMYGDSKGGKNILTG